jgi:hypothetical protein
MIFVKISNKMWNIVTQKVLKSLFNVFLINVLKSHRFYLFLRLKFFCRNGLFERIKRTSVRSSYHFTRTFDGFSRRRFWQNTCSYHEIAHLITNGVDPFNILALTFTNKAAKEMKERIAKLVGDSNARSLWMGTFHSVFARFLEAKRIIRLSF